MIDFSKLRDYVYSQKLNLYDLAVRFPGGAQAIRFQPCNTCNNGYSAAKAFIMSAAGLMADQGLMRVDMPVSGLLGGVWPDDIDPAWTRVTLEHVLTHRVGFDRGFLDIDVEDMRDYPTDDYLTMILRHPLPLRPGQRRVYSDAAFYLMARIVEAVSGQPVDALLWEKLLAPMNFGQVAWSRCPRGHLMGATGLYCSAEDLVKLAWLYLNGGVYGSRRLLSDVWVRTALERGYELTPLRASGFIGKRGMWGQGLCFSPQRRLAAAWLGHVTPQEADRFIDALPGLLPIQD